MKQFVGDLNAILQWIDLSDKTAGAGVLAAKLRLTGNFKFIIGEET